MFPSHDPQGGFSNNFTLPLTAKNRKILGFPDDLNTASRKPYEKVGATLFDRGARVADGYLRLNVVDGRELETSFFSDNVNWFNLIKGKSIKDLNLSEFDHEWSYDVIATAISADKSTGYVYPLIDYGDWSDQAVSPGEGPTLDVYEHELYPALFVHNILDRIYFEA